MQIWFLLIGGFLRLIKRRSGKKNRSLLRLFFFFTELKPVFAYALASLSVQLVFGEAVILIELDLTPFLW